VIGFKKGKIYGRGDIEMKKAIVFLIAICVICVSISGAAVSENINIDIEEKELYPINPATESPEVNARFLSNINQVVDDYMNMDENLYGKTSSTPKEIEYPWSDHPLPRGDFVEWVIRVNYNGKHFQEVIDISPIDFKERFLEHPLHYESVFFDVNEDDIDDLQVFYSVYTSTLINYQQGIETKSLETCLKVNAGDIEDREALLEVWSEIRINYGLLTSAKTKERSQIFNGRFATFFVQFLEKIQSKFENTRFTLVNSIINKILSKLQRNTNGDEPDAEPHANDADYIMAGIGIGSPEGEKVPIYFEKRFGIAKKNIFSPIIFEHELKQVQSREPLELLFGFQAFKAGHPDPDYDIAFSQEFDPAIYIRTQFIPMGGYVYYNFDSGSGHSQETRLTFTGRINEGVGDNIELTLIFDSTNPLAQSGNWISFDLDIFNIFEQEIMGFHYRANKKFDIGVLVSSPIFSGKVDMGGIPTSVDLGFKVDVDITVQEDLFDGLGEAILYLDMNSDLEDINIYYPKLSPEEPDVKFIKFSDMPQKQTLTAHADLYIDNSSMLTVDGNGWIDLDMSDQLGTIEIFYPKADPNDPDQVCVRIPSGLPRTQEIGARAKLYMDPNDFYNTDNYVFGRAYRTSNGNILEICGYLPGETDPIVRITEIPSNSEAKGKLEWNNLKGYAHVERSSAQNQDPIELDIDLGTYNLYNYLEILDGHIHVDFHLAEDGYFGFDTANDMFADLLKVTDTSTGNQLQLGANKVNANDLWVDWALDTTAEPVQVEELAFGGELSILEDFEIIASYQGKYLNFETDWQVGEQGEFSVDLNQNEPIELTIDDLFPSDPTWSFGGGVIISQDFHFDIKWKLKQGETYDDPGYLLINEDTNDPNWDWIGMTLTYDPSGSNNPQYGIQVGGTDISVIVYLKWWKHPQEWFPQVWWYATIEGNFYLDLLWNEDWYYNVHTW
jgi:hypothetical protein